MFNNTWSKVGWRDDGGIFMEGKPCLITSLKYYVILLKEFNNFILKFSIKLKSFDSQNLKGARYRDSKSYIENLINIYLLQIFRKYYFFLNITNYLFLQDLDFQALRRLSSHFLAYL